MRILITILCICFFLSSNTYCTVYAVQSGSATSNNAAQPQPKHPKLKKYAMIAGVGLLTGGVGGALLGTGVVHGAMMGAGSHVAFHAAKDKYNADKAKKHQTTKKQHKSKKHDHVAKKHHHMSKKHHHKDKNHHSVHKHHKAKKQLA